MKAKLTNLIPDQSAVEVLSNRFSSKYKPVISKMSNLEWHGNEGIEFNCCMNGEGEWFEIFPCVLFFVFFASKILIEGTYAIVMNIYQI